MCVSCSEEREELKNSFLYILFCLYLKTCIFSGNFTHISDDSVHKNVYTVYACRCYLGFRYILYITYFIIIHIRMIYTINFVILFSMELSFHPRVLHRFLVAVQKFRRCADENWNCLSLFLQMILHTLMHMIVILAL